MYKMKKNPLTPTLVCFKSSMLALGTSVASERAESTTNQIKSQCRSEAFGAKQSFLPFLLSDVLFCAELEVWAMSELAWGVTLVFTVSPLPFPFLSFFEFPLGTSAMSFCGSEKNEKVNLSFLLDVWMSFFTLTYRVNPQSLHLVCSFLCDGQELLRVGQSVHDG